jgi:hypothetical protein
MSRDLQEKADVIMKELQEALVPVVEELNKMKAGAKKE